MGLIEKTLQVLFNIHTVVARKSSTWMHKNKVISDLNILILFEALQHFS